MKKSSLLQISFLFLNFAIILGLVFLGFNSKEILSEHFFRPGIRLLDGTEVSTFDDIVSSDTVVVIVVYFQTSCEYCKQELRTLSAINIQGVQIIGMNVGQSVAKVREFAKQYPRVKFVVGISDVPSGGVPYTEVAIRTEQGWQLADKWTGYQPEKISALRQKLEDVSEEN